LTVGLVGLFPSLALASSDDAFSRALSHGPIAAALAAFLGGFLVSLTPCVYPMVAVTVSVFGARQARTRFEGIGLSAAFVAGMVAMFVPLGVAAALGGNIFGSVLQNSWVLAGMSALFALMAASMFGAFELALPSGLTNRLATVGGFGYKGAFALGLVSALVASPCTGPVLTGILTWIARTRDGVLGAAAMAAFALGLGVPFFLVGAFALQLPKSGRWMMHIKSFFGLVLPGIALHFLGIGFPALPHLVPNESRVLLLGSGLLVLGLGLGAVQVDFASASRARQFGKSMAIVAVVLGGWLVSVQWLRPKGELHFLHEPFDVVAQRARREARPLVVDFGAEWCGACKKLEQTTFADPLVREAAARFLAVKVDATDDTDLAVASTLKRLHVAGLPTVILFDAQGREVQRFTDYVEPAAFAAALRSVP